MGAKIKNGDRIRVVVEGPAFDLIGAHTTQRLTDTFVRDGVVILGEDDIVTVEKIEPTVVTFKPGDVVRRKSDGLRYLVMSDGWAPVGSGWGGSYHAESEPAKPFTSKHYEKVSID